MNELKRIFFALAVAVSLGLVGTSDAFAQASCTANSVPTLVRAQGLTELTGSLSLNNCTGAIPAGGASLTVTIQPATAVITNGTAAVPPGTAGFVPTIVISTQGLGADGVPGTADDPAAVVGAPVAASALSGNTVTFAVAATPAGSRLLTVQIGIVPGIAATVGIRVNANASGVVFPSQISGLLTSSPPGVLAITNNLLNVAIPLPALAATWTSGGAIAQCVARALSSAAPAGASFTPTYTAGVLTGSTNTAAGWGVIGVTSTTASTPSSVPRVTISEGFPSSFQTAAGEGADITAGLGTQILFRITDLPSNVVIYAPNQVANGAAAAGPYAAPTFELTLVTTAGALAAASGTVGPAGVGQLGSTLVGTTFTYQVTAESDAVAEAITIPLALFTTGTPSVSTSAGSVALSPISTVGTAVVIATAAIPRFADVPFSGTIVTVIPCVTNILFPFVANTVGFETGFAIANTTSDVFGTSSQSGSCVYNFFGTNAPSGGTFTTPAFAGGVTDVRLLSAIAPGFQGYVIAQCNFQLGHGFFFIQNGFGTGTATIAQGGPALIILQPGTTSTTTRRGLASGGAAAAPPFGEALGH
ncbi:MAG: hypothetical protein HY649_09335 [Acidobacteria bacterium]|nr:hypothetical protein [Acidobacteriota bacterium]